MYSVRTSFALYFVQLDNNKKHMYLRLFKIIVRKEWFQSTIWLLYFQVQSPPSLPPPPYFHLDINFFTHGTLSSYPFIPLPTLWLTCPSSTSSLLPIGCQYSLHNKLSLFPFPISHPSIHSFIDSLVLLSLQPSSHPLSTTLFLSFFLPVAANEVRWSAKKIATGEKCQPIQGICYRDITLINLAKYQSLYAGGLKSNFIN